MAYTLQATKSNGGNISRAELVTFLDNLEWFYTPPAYRVYSLGGETVETAIGVMDWSPSAGGHNEWREGGAGNLSTVYTDSTGGLWVNVGDVADGVWLNGVMFAIEQPPTAASTYTVRRVQLRRGDGTTFTEIADANVRGDQGAQRTSLHIHGVGAFTTTTDRVDVRARTAGASLDVIGDRRWGVRFGSATALADNYASARQVSDTNDEMTGAWNRLRLNHARIERRPSGQRYKTGSNQSITASTVTLVTMGASDWGSDGDMVPPASFLNLVIAQQSGLYFVWSQATFDSLDSGSSFAEIRIQRDGTTDLVTANAPDQLGSSAEDTTVTACDLVPLTAGQYIQTNVLTGIGSTVEASRGTQMHATLLSSDNGVSPDRQVFAQMPHPDTWPNVAGMSSDRLPAGTMRVLSDLTDRQWHRPAFKASLGDDIEVDSSGGWTDVDCDVPVFDYTDLEETHGITVFSDGGLVLPWAGLWLVGARLGFSQTSAGGVAIGNDRLRGMRLALGKKRGVGAIIGRAMNGTGHGWTRTLAETVVTNADEVEVKLQGLVEIADGGAAMVTAAHIWAVELGSGITRDPR